MLVLSAALSLFAWTLPASASHDWGGIDVCSAYRSSAPPGIDPAALPQPESAGARLVTRYCAQCHELPGPGRHTAEEWPAVLDRMLVLMDVSQRFGGLMGRVRAPAATEREQLRAYLERHALVALAEIPREAQARAFVAQCRACHALPDPGLHAAADWPDVVARMRRHADIMQRGQFGDAEAAAVTDYLRAASGPSVRIVGDPHGGARRVFVAADAQGGAAGVERLAYLSPFVALVALGAGRWGYRRYRERGAGRA